MIAQQAYSIVATILKLRAEIVSRSPTACRQDNRFPLSSGCAGCLGCRRLSTLVRLFRSACA